MILRDERSEKQGFRNDFEGRNQNIEVTRRRTFPSCEKHAAIGKLTILKNSFTTNRGYECSREIVRTVFDEEVEDVSQIEREAS